MNTDLINGISQLLTGIVRTTNATRESLAADLAEITEDLRRGGIIPAEAWAQAQKDAAQVSATRGSLPARPKE